MSGVFGLPVPERSPLIGWTYEEVEDYFNLTINDRKFPEGDDQIFHAGKSIGVLGSNEATGLFTNVLLAYYDDNPKIECLAVKPPLPRHVMYQQEAVLEFPYPILPLPKGTCVYEVEDEYGVHFEVMNGGEKDSETGMYTFRLSGSKKGIAQFMAERCGMKNIEVKQ